MAPDTASTVIHLHHPQADFDYHLEVMEVKFPLQVHGNEIFNKMNKKIDFLESKINYIAMISTKIIKICNLVFS